MFKAVPLLSRAKSAVAARADARSTTQGQAPRAAAAATPDDPHAIGAEGWLTTYDIKKSYRKRMVVKGVSLALRRGEAVGLLEQNIMAVLELVEPDKKKRKEQLDSLLEEFTITRLRKSPSMALSGGERRRCEIARALASRPSFMLLDEPFAGIDPIAVGDIQQLVRHLTERGIGVLITDHNVRETLSLIDRAYIIYDGQVLTQGKPSEIIANEDVRRVYLGDMFVNTR